MAHISRALENLRQLNKWLPDLERMICQSSRQTDMLMGKVTKAASHTVESIKLHDEFDGSEGRTFIAFRDAISRFHMLFPNFTNIVLRAVSSTTAHSIYNVIISVGHIYYCGYGPPNMVFILELEGFISLMKSVCTTVEIEAGVCFVCHCVDSLEDHNIELIPVNLIATILEFAVDNLGKTEISKNVYEGLRNFLIFRNSIAQQSNVTMKRQRIMDESRVAAFKVMLMVFKAMETHQSYTHESIEDLDPVTIVNYFMSTFAKLVSSVMSKEECVNDTARLIRLLHKCSNKLHEGAANVCVEGITKLVTHTIESEHPVKASIDACHAGLVHGFAKTLDYMRSEKPAHIHMFLVRDTVFHIITSVDKWATSWPDFSSRHNLHISEKLVSMMRHQGFVGGVEALLRMEPRCAWDCNLAVLGILRQCCGHDMSEELVSGLVKLVISARKLVYSLPKSIGSQTTVMTIFEISRLLKENIAINIQRPDYRRLFIITGLWMRAMYMINVDNNTYMESRDLLEPCFLEVDRIQQIPHNKIQWPVCLGQYFEISGGITLLPGYCSHYLCMNLSECSESVVKTNIPAGTFTDFYAGTNTQYCSECIAHVSSTHRDRSQK